MSKPKTHNVYSSTADGLAEILSQATADEPAPTAAAAELVEEAQHAGPIVPVLSGAPTLPGAAGGSGGAGELVGADPPGPTPRESAENILELAFAMAPADWRPDDEAERDELTRALERVFAYRNFTPSLPPEVTLIAVAGKYARRRMSRPAVRNKLAPLLARIPILNKLVPAPAGGLDTGLAPGDVVRGNPFQTLPRMTPPEGGA